MGWLTVIQSGMQTTVQDLGRPGNTAIGVPPGGAFDALSLRAGNRLLGNPDNASALECTLVGPTLKFEHDTAVAITGAHCLAATPPPWTRATIRAGETLAIGNLSGGPRAYLCIAGGLKVPPILGSTSTLLSAGFGGHRGRALKAGDRLDFNDASPPQPLSPSTALLVARVHHEYTEANIPLTLRAVNGPHPHAFNAAAVKDFWSANFRVSNQSDRTGVRLQGITFSTLISGDMTSEGMPPGAIQITPSGQPIAFGVDGPTTGGYPVIATIATADLHMLGRALPGQRIHFDRVSLQEAREALIARELAWEGSMH